MTNKVATSFQCRMETILNAPGLVGEMTQYINEVSFKEQPILAISAAIVGVGAIYGHRLQSPSGLRTNIYMFSLADSGAGKDGGRKALKILFDKLPESFSKIVCGDPASAPGLLSALSKSDGVGLFLIDEIGHYLSGINNRNAQSHTRDIMPLLTKLFTSADTMYRGTEYSDRTRGMESRKDIDQPCACVLGSSVPERVYGAITIDDICDGFLPRWLVFESKNIAARNNPHRRLFDESCGVKLVETILARTKIIDAQSSLPMVVPIDNAAYEILKNFETFTESMRIKAINEGSQMKYIYTRAYEHAEKLAMIACEFVDGLPVVTQRSAQWAIAVVEQSIEQMQSVIVGIAASPHEQNRNKMYEIIQRRGKMNKSEFCNFCGKWKHREREELLSDLTNMGRVKQYKDDNNITYVEPI